jgi:hypothetical protein
MKHRWIIRSFSLYTMRIIVPMLPVALVLLSITLIALATLWIRSGYGEAESFEVHAHGYSIGIVRDGSRLAIVAGNDVLGGGLTFHHFKMRTGVSELLLGEAQIAGLHWSSVANYWIVGIAGPAFVWIIVTFFLAVFLWWIRRKIQPKAKGRAFPVEAGEAGVYSKNE